VPRARPCLVESDRSFDSTTRTLAEVTPGRSAPSSASRARSFSSDCCIQESGSSCDTAGQEPQDEVETAVLVAVKDFLSIVSALGDVMREFGNDESGDASHAWKEWRSAGETLRRKWKLRSLSARKPPGESTLDDM